MLEIILYLIAKVASLALGAAYWIMFIRVVFELIGRVTSYDIGSSKPYIFCYAVSEAVAAPIRYICYKLNIFQGTPMDIPFLITMIAVMMLKSLLPII